MALDLTADDNLSFQGLVTIEEDLKPYVLEWPSVPDADGLSEAIVVLLKRQGGFLLGLPPGFVPETVLSRANLRNLRQQLKGTNRRSRRTGPLSRKAGHKLDEISHPTRRARNDHVKARQIRRTGTRSNLIKTKAQRPQPPSRPSKKAESKDPKPSGVR